MKTIKFQISDEDYHMLKIYIKYGYHEKDKLLDSNTFYEFEQWCWEVIKEIKALISEDEKLLTEVYGEYKKRYHELRKFLYTDECKEIIKVYKRYNNDKDFN